MLQQNGIGNIDWMSLAAKMFMNKMSNQTPPQKHRVGKPTSPSPSPLRARSPAFKPRMTASATPPLSHLPPACVATIKQFEALRVQLLRQLVLYQTELLALKMPPLSWHPPQPMQKATPSKGKVAQNGLSKVKKQTSSKKVKSGQSNEVKKWEKIQSPAHTMKNTNKRRSQAFQKPKKSSKKASKRKLENIQTAVSDSYFDNNVSNKRPCQPYKSYMRNSSSSTESVYSTKHLKYNSGFVLEPVSRKDVTPQVSSFINSSNINEGKNNALTSRLSKRRASKLNKKISSAFVFDTPTDEA